MFGSSRFPLVARLTVPQYFSACRPFVSSCRALRALRTALCPWDTPRTVISSTGFFQPGAQRSFPRRYRRRASGAVTLAAHVYRFVTVVNDVFSQPPPLRLRRFPVCDAWPPCRRLLRRARCKRLDATRKSKVTPSPVDPRGNWTRPAVSALVGQSLRPGAGVRTWQSRRCGQSDLSRTTTRKLHLPASAFAAGFLGYCVAPKQFRNAASAPAHRSALRRRPASRASWKIGALGATSRNVANPRFFVGESGRGNRRPSLFEQFVGIAALPLRPRNDRLQVASQHRTEPANTPPWTRVSCRRVALRPPDARAIGSARPQPLSPLPHAHIAHGDVD